jgi:hypothetical protein
MNLVIDEAVEVTLANPKKDTAEERREIGQSRRPCHISLANGSQARFCSRVTTSH